MQGLVFRNGDPRFAGDDAAAAVACALADAACTMINRNAGSGTRILIDRLLDGRQPPGYGVQAKSHNAVATAVAQGRADWGMAIDTVAKQYGIGFIPVQEEHYDFVVPNARRDRPGVQLFIRVLQEPAVRARLRALGFRLD
jgi:putative molybdopterin biosynthesis protein